jgi:hypothetical protein
VTYTEAAKLACRPASEEPGPEHSSAPELWANLWQGFRENLAERKIEMCDGQDSNCGKFDGLLNITAGSSQI